MGSNVADKRIHGTTKRQVEKVFNEVERPALRPLPASLFPFFEEAQRTVHRDGHVELKGAYTPCRPNTSLAKSGRAGSIVWCGFTTCAWNRSPCTRAESGKFSTDPAHIHSHKRLLVERGADWLLDRARLIGKYSGTWAEAMFKTRGPQAIRVLQGLLSLAEKHPVAQLEHACQQAVEYGAWRLRDLRALPERAPAQQLTFLEKHPLIRDLEAYGHIVPVCFAPTPSTPTIKEQTHEPNEP